MSTEISVEPDNMLNHLCCERKVWLSSVLDFLIREQFVTYATWDEVHEIFFYHQKSTMIEILISPAEVAVVLCKIFINIKSHLEGAKRSRENCSLWVDACSNQTFLNIAVSNYDTKESPRCS